MTVGDLKISQSTVVSPPAYIDRFVTPVIDSLFGFDDNGLPVTVTLGANLTLVGNILSALGGGGGSGTVTSVAVGNLSPLFTSSVASPTTAASVSFALSTQTANRFFAGPASGSAVAPTFRAIVAADLPATAVTPDSFGSATQVGAFTVDAAGRLTAASNVTITLAFSSITGKPTTVSGYGITDAALNGAIGSSGLTMNTARLLGRSAGGVGAIEEITIGSGLAFAGGILSTTDAGGTVTSVSVATANGISGTVTDPTTTPAITIVLGAITPTSINGLTITTSSGTLTITNGKTLSISNTLAFSGTDGSTLNIGGGGTLGTAAFTAASAYEVPLNFSTGLTRTTNTITVNTSQNIAKLSNLTTNGFVKTSGGDGTLSIDTSTYLTGNQTITLTGDVTGSGTTAIATILANIPTGTPAAGSLLATAIAAPATPAVGKGSIYVDSTSKNLAVKNDAGVVNHGIQSRAGTTNNWIRAIADDGSTTISQPAFSDISGSVADAQMPALTGDATTTAGTVAVTVARINGVSLAGLATGILKNTTITGAPSIAVAADFPTLNQNTTGSAATLTTARAIYGNNFDGSAALTQIIASTFGGTGNGFTKFSGPTTAEKTFTLPNASATILTDNAVVTGAQGGTGVNNTGKTITLGGNLTLSGAFASTFTVSAATTVTFPTTGTLATLAGVESLTNKKLGSLTTNGFVTTTSSDGTLVVTSAAAFTSGTLAGLTGLAIRDTSAAFDVTVAATSSTTLTAGRTLTLDVANSARTLKLTGNPTLSDWFDQSVKSTASPTFASNTTITGPDGAIVNLNFNSYSGVQAFHAPRFNSLRARGTSGAPAVVQAGDELFSIECSGYNGSSGQTFCAGIFVTATGTITGATVPAYMSFYTNASISGTEKMRLSENGNLLIGTTTDITGSGGLSVATTLTTAAPAGASAHPWKLGSLVTGLTLTASLTQAVYVDINGTVFKLLTGV